MHQEQRQSTLAIQLNVIDACMHTAEPHTQSSFMLGALRVTCVTMCSTTCSVKHEGGLVP